MVFDIWGALKSLGDLPIIVLDLIIFPMLHIVWHLCYEISRSEKMNDVVNHRTKQLFCSVIL